MWSGENQGSDFSVSSFGISVPQLVKGSSQLLLRDQPGSGSYHDVHCGLLGFYPAFLQSYRTPRCYLVFLCVLGMTQGFVVNGLVSVVTPTIEKRFQLLGIEAGMIQSMFNVASCIMVTPVSYHGGIGHKPLIMGIGALVMSAGSMVFASPHFLAPQYMVVDSGAADVCPQRGPGQCGSSASSGATNANAFKYFFMVRVLPAIERAKDLSRLQKEKRMQSLKHAPSAANVQAAPDALASSDSQAAPDAQAAMPASQAPSEAQATPGSQAAPGAKGTASAHETPNPGAASRPHDMQVALEVTTGKEQKRSFANHVRRLLCNPTFVCLTLAACAETMIASGLTGFATKIFISMFGISSSRASSLLGIVSVPSACGGTLLGGYVVTKLNVKSSTIVRYCVVLSFVPWFTLFVFTHSCPSSHRALVNLTTNSDE
nr:solute carrier organic anion transporter family member 4A1-like [Dermacentor andersoni]